MSARRFLIGLISNMVTSKFRMSFNRRILSNCGQNKQSVMGIKQEIFGEKDRKGGKECESARVRECESARVRASVFD
ncbi:hypothetical protein BCT30_11165 [Enterovibrio norvegicus]|nr:hypothetical protein BCT30_11165 [Enterovibrio norvegicus]